jgi:Ca-activated chloride channel family protein
MQFAQPLFLLLFLPAAAFLWASWRHVKGMARFRKRLAFGLRALLLTSIVLALAQPMVVLQNRGLCTIFVVDRSMSIREKDRRRQMEFINRSVQALGPDDLAGLVAFGKDALVEAATGGKRLFGQIESRVDGSETDLAAAIRLATALFPEGKNRRIVVLTDGNETLGDAREAAMVAGTLDTQIDTVAMGQDQSAPEASVIGMDSPNSSTLDEPFRLRVQVESNIAQNATLQLERDGQEIQALGVHLQNGSNSVVFQDKVSSPGFHHYRAVLLPEKDTDPRNNLGETFVAVRTKPKILVLQEHPEEHALFDALKKSGLDCELKGPGGIPVSSEEIADYDAVILNDLNALHFMPVQLRLLEASIRESGTGFAMIGGDDSFLPGGYYGTPLADALAVDLNIKQRKEFPSASILIVVDASGSMGMYEDGFEKIRLAANAAEQTVRLVSSSDRIGVAGSSDSVEFIAPMQLATNKDAIASELRKLRTEAGGIYCDMSVKFAKGVLEKETNPVRHFIMLADGDDSEAQEGCDAVVAQMRLEHITTSTVAIGSGKDLDFLRHLAAIGGGRYYLADKASKLPAILTQDTAVMARSAVEEGAFYPKIVSEDPVLNGIDSTPPLLAYCLTSARPLANTSMLTKKDDPLLARWHYGLGTSLAFTSDAKPKWAKHWTSWAGYDAFWSQAVRSIVRQKSLNNFRIAVDQSSGKSEVEIDATDDLGNPMNKLEGKVTLIDPGGKGTAVDVAETAPGVFKGAFDSAQLGTYIVSVSEPDPKGEVRMSSAGFSVPYPPELRTSKPNTVLLKALADSTGGRVLGDGDPPLTRVKNGVSISEIWTVFVSAALILLPLDIAVRRLALPFQEIWLGFLSLFRRRQQAQVVEASPVSRLQQAKVRAKRDVGKEAPLPVSDVAAAPRAVQPPAAAGSSSSRLLDAKRSRSEK